MTPEGLALDFVRALYNSTDGQTSQWRTVAGLSSNPNFKMAVAYAEEKGWIERDREQSVCLTEQGRRLIKPN